MLMTRAILNVSLPDQATKSKLEERAKRKGYPSVSAYILHAIEMEDTLIDEDEVLAIESRAIAAYKAGKTITGLDHLKRIAA